MSERRVIRPSNKLLIKYYIYLALVILLCIFPFEFLAFAPGLGWGYVVIYTLANLLWIVPMMVLIPFYYRSIEYEMGEEEVIVRRGIITKTETTVPYRTVTNIDIKRGPLDRLLALGGLKIHTAGYSQQVAAEASLSGLSEYEQIYEALRSALRRYRARTGQTVGAEEVPAAEEGVGADVRHLLADILQELRALRRALEERG